MDESTIEFALLGYANDTSFVDFFRDKLDFSSDLSVSVVISHYNALDELDMCLSNLCKQTYPSNKLDVVIADDGSCDDPTPIATKYVPNFMKCRVVTQDDLGFRLSAVRNLGIEVASSDYIILLDCDIIPHRALVENHMEALQISNRVISIGFRKDNSASEDVAFGEIEKDDLDWRYQKLLREHEDFYKLTNQPYIFSSGGNIAFHKSVWEAEKFDESFTEWGGEDNEWGYRLTQQGYYFYPNELAVGWHLSDPTYKKVSNFDSRRKYLDKCAGVSYENACRNDLESPFVSFWITSHNKADFISEAIESVKNCKFSYEILIVENSSTDGSLELVRSLAEKDRRLRIVTELSVGPYFAYERALNEARGELLIQLDADDAIVTETLEDLIVRNFYEPYGLMYGLTEACSLDLEPLVNSVWVPSEANIRNFNVFKGMSIRNPRVVRRRDLSRICKRKEYSAAVDYELYSKLLFLTKPLRADQVMYKYRTNTHNSITKCINETQKLNAKDITRRNIEALNKFSDTYYYVEHLGLNRTLITDDLLHSMVQACGFKY